MINDPPLLPMNRFCYTDTQKQIIKSCVDTLCAVQGILHFQLPGTCKITVRFISLKHMSTDISTRNAHIENILRLAYFWLGLGPGPPPG